MRDGTLKYALLAPALLILIATLFYPLAQSFFYSLHDWNLGRAPAPEGWAGWANYADLLTNDPAFLYSAWVTLVFTVPSVVLTIVVALALALLLAGSGRLQVNARTLLVIPFAMSPALIGISWRFMLNPEFGVVDALLKTLPGWSPAPVLSDPFWAMAALVAVDVWHWSPYFMLTFVGALAVLPQDTLDAAQVDGASRTRMFFDIILPQLKPALTIAVLLKTIFSLKMLDQVVTMTAGGPGAATDTLPHMIYSTAFRFYDVGYAAAMAWLLALTMMALALLYARVAMRREG